MATKETYPQSTNDRRETEYYPVLEYQPCVGIYKSGARLFILSFFNWKDIINLWKKGVDYDENNPIHYRRTDIARYWPAADLGHRIYRRNLLFPLCII